MAIPQSNVEVIQQAGQALFQAVQVTATTVEAQASELVSIMAKHPGQPITQQSISQFQRLAHISQDLQALESKLREVYLAASELASPAADVLIPAASSLPQLGMTTSSVQDVEIKPRRVGRRLGKRSAKPEATSKAPVKLSRNDEKALAYMTQNLDATHWVRVRGVDLAHGAGLPLGSVGVCLARLTKAGLIVKGERGQYRLAKA